MKTYLVVLPFIFLAACTQTPLADGARMGPFFHPANISRPSPKLPVTLHRVLVLIPVDATADRILTPETLSDLHRVLISALTQSARFELIPVTNQDLVPHTRGIPLNSTAPIPSGVMEQLAITYDAQAILFTDITSHSPYPPLRLGLRTKLARLDNLQILWASDTNFSASDPRVSNSARNYARKHSTSNQAGNLTYTILQNPTRFAEYAVYSLCETLPIR